MSYKGTDLPSTRRFLKAISWLLALVCLVPVFSLLLEWGENSQWAHVREHLLNELVVNSLKLVLLVCVGSATLGLSLAWLVSQYEFPYKKWLSKFLLLPLAVPPYVCGFVYVGLFEYSGPVASFLRKLGFSRELWLDIRNVYGVAFVLSLSLYPYVYLILKHAFSTISASMIEAARSLGEPMSKVFVRLVLPACYPWLLGALSLVAMETLADFATVSVFSYSTFTTAIYRSWYGLFSPSTAAQLASLLILPISLLYVFEQWANSKRKRKIYESNLTKTSRASAPLSRFNAWLMSGFCFFVIFLALMIPGTQLLFWLLENTNIQALADLLEFMQNSLIIAISVAFVVCIASILLSLNLRFTPGRLNQILVRVSTLGYALPGALLAIAVYLPLAKFDHTIADFLEKFTDKDIGLIFTGSMFAMLIGLSIRFLAVGFQSIHSNLKRISGRLDEVAITYGVVGVEQIRKIHLPLLKKPIIFAFVLVAIDTLKEIPLTLMTRGYGWDTLSVKIFEFISEGQWQKAALPAFMLICISLIPVYLIDPSKSEGST